MHRHARPLLICLLTISAFAASVVFAQDSEKFRLVRRDRPSDTDPIPKAIEPISAENARWWEALRASARELKAALARKDEALADASSRFLEARSPVPSDEDILLGQSELARLNADVTQSRDRFISLVQEGQTNSYRVPISDRPPLFISIPHPQYSEEARRKKIGGIVIVAVDFRADGTLGDIEVVKNIGRGLDESAVNAAAQLLFLPAVKNGSFVPMRTRVQFSYSIN